MYARIKYEEGPESFRGRHHYQYYYITKDGRWTRNRLVYMSLEEAHVVKKILDSKISSGGNWAEFNEAGEGTYIENLPNIQEKDNNND